MAEKRELHAAAWGCTLLMATLSVPLIWLLDTGRETPPPALASNAVRRESATIEMSIAWRRGAAAAIRASGSWCPDTQYGTKSLLQSDENRSAFRLGCIGSSGEVKEYTLFADRLMQTVRLSAS